MAVNTNPLWVVTPREKKITACRFPTTFNSAFRQVSLLPKTSSGYPQSRATKQ